MSSRNNKYTIRILASKFNLSRSTLLYYDKINLLKPSERSEKNYRLYSEEDKDKLEKICMYADMGISLKDVKEILRGSNKKSGKILENHLEFLGNKINKLREQQFSIVKILQKKSSLRKSGILTTDDWVKILESTGLDKKGRHKWHYEFETNSPIAHRDFLYSLGIDENEIKKIRKWSKEFKYL